MNTGLFLNINSITEFLFSSALDFSYNSWVIGFSVILIVVVFFCTTSLLWRFFSYLASTFVRAAIIAALVLVILSHLPSSLPHHASPLATTVTTTTTTAPISFTDFLHQLQNFTQHQLHSYSKLVAPAPAQN